MSIKETKPEFVERELLWQHPRIARKEVVERWTILDMGGEQRLRLHLCAYHLHLHLVVDTGQSRRAALSLGSSPALVCVFHLHLYLHKCV